MPYKKRDCECRFCKRVFLSSDIRQKYCGSDCYHNSRKGLKRKPLSEETKLKLSIANKGRKLKPFTQEHKNKISLANIKLFKIHKLRVKNGIGIKRPYISERNKKWKGENHPCWKGGISTLNARIRQSDEYKKWRKMVFERDGHICHKCLQKGGLLEAHHIFSFSKYPELRFKIFNGITLCKPCHKTTDNYAGRVKN